MKKEIRERIDKIKNKEIPQGYKKTSIGIFPEEWEIKKILEVSQSIRATSSKEGLPVLTISAGNGFLDQRERFSKVIAGKSLEKYTYLQKDEFSYNRGNSKSFKYGCIYKLENVEEALVPNVYHSFKFNKGCTDYYKFLFESKFLDRQLRTLISSSARMDGLLNINRDDFMELKLLFPSLKEQEKIAEILTKWDEGIAKQEELIEKKKRYKKGMMQKIFSQKIRFKDENGNDYPEWEQKKLNDLLKSQSSTITNNTLEENEGIYAVYGATGFIKNIDYYESQSDYIAIVKDGAGVGRTLFCKAKSSILATLQYLFAKENNNLKFLYYILNMLDFSKFIVGSTIPHIYFKDYGLEKFKVPSLPEQEKIAVFLSTIDKEIEVLEKELEILKKEKQSLMSLLLNGIVRTV